MHILHCPENLWELLKRLKRRSKWKNMSGFFVYEIFLPYLKEQAGVLDQPDEDVPSDDQIYATILDLGHDYLDALSETDINSLCETLGIKKSGNMSKIRHDILKECRKRYENG